MYINKYRNICKRLIVCVLVFLLPVSGCSKEPEISSENVAQNSNADVGLKAEYMIDDDHIETPEQSNTETVIDKLIEDDPREVITFSEEELRNAEEIVLNDGFENVNYYGISDEDLRQSIQDKIYEELDLLYDESEITIEDIQSQYFSKEYLEELAYNSKTNVFFGYSLEELKNRYGDNNYVFTLGDDGTTIVKEFSKHENIYDDVIKNTLIGSGVILVCVTLLATSTIAAAPLGISRLQIILSFSAGGAVIGGTVVGSAAAAAVGVTEYIKNGDSHAALEASLLAGSEGFKWGAIGGTVVGTALGTYITSSIHTPRESEQFIKKLFPRSEEQKIFKDGIEISTKVPGSTVPDLVTKLPDGTLQAIEVKNYNLSKEGISSLISTLRNQLSIRVANMPPGTIQRLVLDVTGRGYNKTEMTFIVKLIKNSLSTVCPDLLISVVGFV